VRRLDLVVGPNGSGKSTFVRLTFARVLPPGSPADPQAHAYDAAAVAADTRSALIASGQSFIAETVFSHPSKLELIDTAHAAGYTAFVHVLLVPEELAVARVWHRANAGGHAVPEDKVRQRYRRLWPLVVEAIARTDAASVYDNSALAGPRIVAGFVEGLPTAPPNWPTWAPPELTAPPSS
jgi:predicted ABC-type ATPase